MRSKNSDFIPEPRIERGRETSLTICGGNGLRVPPVPIPNTEVKPQHADGTWLETARESRSLPHSNSRSAFIADRAFFLLERKNHMIVLSGALKKDAAYAAKSLGSLARGD